MPETADQHQLGELFREEVAVRLSSRNAFQPDLAFFSSARKDLILPRITASLALIEG